MSENNKTPARRDFLKFSGLAILAGAVGSQLVRQAAYAQGAAPKAAPGGAAPKAAPGGAEAKKAEGDLKMVDPKDAQAQALGYYEDAEKVDTKKWAKRADAAGKKQFCYNCQFFQHKDPKTAKAAPCTIFGGKGVAAKGWCNSWVQNPTVQG